MEFELTDKDSLWRRVLRLKFAHAATETELSNPAS